MGKPSNEERLPRALIRGFRRHWRKILHDLEGGEPSLAKAHYRYFEADTNAKRKYLARKFYGLKHARKIANLTDEEIRKNLEFCFPGAIEYIMGVEDDPRRQEEAARDLIKEEYILCAPPTDSNYYEDWIVRGYPNHRGYYDGWYYNTFEKYYSEREFSLLKSTGESFSKEELEWLRLSIIYSIEYNFDGEDVFWDFDMHTPQKNRVEIHIWEIEREDYKKRVISEIKKLTKKQLARFLKETKALFEKKTYASLEPEVYCPIKVDRYFRNGINRSSKKSILLGIRRILRENIIKDYVLKEMEHILDRISDGKYDPRGRPFVFYLEVKS